MKLLTPRYEIRSTLHRQLLSFFPLGDEEIAQLDASFDEALVRCDTCFSHVKNKYYHHCGESIFNPLHGCQWSAFLYYLANTIYQHNGTLAICDKIYLLSKVLSSADLYYQVALPDIFTFDHPLGAIMGRATYSSFFSFSQGCTVGNNKGIYPSFGQSVFMLSNSKVIGDCRIGDNVIISAGSYIKDTDIPSNSLVFGESPNLIIKSNRQDYIRNYAEKIFKYE